MCFIFHNWGKWGEPYLKIFTRIIPFGAGAGTEQEKQEEWQSRTCIDCGITEERKIL